MLSLKKLSNLAGVENKGIFPYKILDKNLKEYININEELAEILINNLLSNAIRHNFNDGYIKLQLDEKQLSIINSGPGLTFDKKQIFQRFQKSSHSTGTGLGLAVVHQICESSRLSVAYSNDVNEHRFTIAFSH